MAALAVQPVIMSLPISAGRQRELVSGGGGAVAGLMGGLEPLKEPCRPSGTHLLWACRTSHSGPHSLTERKVKKERTPGSQGTVLGVFWTWEGIVKPRGILHKETRHGDPGENERT